jgi:hypothetical protein
MEGIQAMVPRIRVRPGAFPLDIWPYFDRIVLSKFSFHGGISPYF